VLDSITPIVLVGGKSSRFGRDKLREPLADGWLVDRPIAALREVFGRRVVAVGDCDEAVAARADAHHKDRYPGTGPLGGILGAIEAFNTDVFVLAGDLPRVDSGVVQAVLSDSGPGALAVCAGTGRCEPCVGLYRASAAGPLGRRLVMGGSLAGAFAPSELRLVEIDRRLVVNANTPEALGDQS
jgi:molybdopterin-guanine dinucleotide biosynthesis protein A